MSSRGGREVEPWDQIDLLVASRVPELVSACARLFVVPLCTRAPMIRMRTITDVCTACASRDRRDTRVKKIIFQPILHILRFAPIKSIDHWSLHFITFR